MRGSRLSAQATLLPARLPASPPPRDITDDSLPASPLLPDDVTSEEVAPPPLPNPRPLSSHRGAPALAVAAADKAAAGWWLQAVWSSRPGPPLVPPGCHIAVSSC